MPQVKPLSPLDTIAGIAKAYREGTLRPSQATRTYLDRIEKHDTAIGAFQAVWAEKAMQAAEAADKAFAAGSVIGPFHGIPFGLKDIFDVEGTVTTFGSKAMLDRVSPATGTMVKRLTGAGGIILGKTKTVECAFGGWGTNQLMGTPYNPWDMDVHRVPGGSSSGSAAAVSGGLAACAIGSDTGGSVRLPASFCGIVGLKVTANQLPLDGIMPLSQTLDTPGPIVQTVRDAVILYEVMLGREGWVMEEQAANGDGFYGELDKGVRGLTLGVMNDAERAVCDADILEAYDMAVDRLKALGAIIEVFNAPFGYGDLAAMNGMIIAVEGYQNHGAYYDDPKAPMDEDVRARMMGGKKLAAWEYVRSLEKRKAMTAEFTHAMKGFDALLTPGAPAVACPVADADQSTTPGYFTRPFNFLEMCGLSLPISLNAQGLPTSMQVVGRGHDEGTVLRIGAAMERDLPPIGRPTFG
ncbi:amidase [Hwanghaeella sp.]|uniref:amidase n=1 Tax=Hwanghaeella sp. TaxID=2605943 RepID=UPI003CCB9A00